MQSVNGVAAPQDKNGLHDHCIAKFGKFFRSPNTMNEANKSLWMSANATEADSNALRLRWLGAAIETDKARYIQDY
jgi:hypothetical protein